MKATAKMLKEKMFDSISSYVTFLKTTKGISKEKLGELIGNHSNQS